MHRLPINQQTRTSVCILAAILFLAGGSPALAVLFDFENAPAGTSLPCTLTVGGITATLSTTGPGGYYFQEPRNTIGMTPTGFSGLALIPKSIDACDLRIEFNRILTNFSILYAPQELACDSSARIRVTAYMSNTIVGGTITNASAGTWPSKTIVYRSPQGFNRVVVHYDAPPPTGGDYGMIFVADNMQAIAPPQPEPPPWLHLGRVGDLIELSWPSTSTNFVLESNSSIHATNAWSPVTDPPTQVGEQNTLLLPTNAGEAFYRLKSP